ncbi:hypothetical protein T265_04356 [Opisthorchis viverrini]|uniref:Uncharacterized protein n=1 Tax=Opisthorchis viverrini TaxID=6198 RepID=A0A074ZSS5_OPIVI|nr:hypothetical protein T265_04356 [Opisthorchis viverrini]KER28887.1 hypothetical protein T265_04356 [Opisthorchis viverrini]
MRIDDANTVDGEAFDTKLSNPRSVCGTGDLCKKMKPVEIGTTGNKVLHVWYFIDGNMDASGMLVGSGRTNTTALLGIDWINRLHLSTLPIENLCSSTPTGGKPTCRPGNRVLLRDYRHGHRRWTVGVVLKRIGQVIYSVQVGSLIWKRHVNQLRPTQCQIPKAEEQLLDLNLLLENFDLSRSAPEATASHVPLKTDPLLQPRRRTGRTRKSVEPLELAPRRKSYVERSKGGGIRKVSFLKATTECPKSTETLSSARC